MDRLLDDSQRELRDTARRYRLEVIDPLEPHKREWIEDHDARFPWEAVEEGSRRGLRTLTVPGEFGGADATALELCLVVEELAAGDMGIAVIFDQVYKIVKAIDNLASQEQKERFFPPFVADDRYLLSAGLIEAAHGTDVHLSPNLDREGTRVTLDTTAVRDGDHWVINGEKRMPSLASTAKMVLLGAQTDPDEPIHRGHTWFLVPADTPGFGNGRVWDKISQRLADNATMVLDQCRVPDANRLGQHHDGRYSPMIGSGNIEAGATTLGSARGAYEHALAYARERVQGGRAIIEHQAVGMMLAEMATELEAARALIWTAARTYDEGYPRTPLQMMSKWFAAETAVEVCKKAMEVCGGVGIMRDNPVQKYMRDCLSFLHSDGTQQGRLLMIQQRMLDADDPFFSEVGRR